MSDIHPHHEDHPHMISRATRRGLALFAVYSALYAGFILLNIFAPNAVADVYINIIRDRSLAITLGGLNLALVYGLALILAAIVLAFVYMRLTRPPR
jgi:hypothetical protein